LPTEEEDFFLVCDFAIVLRHNKMGTRAVQLSWAVDRPGRLTRRAQHGRPGGRARASRPLRKSGWGRGMRGEAGRRGGGGRGLARDEVVVRRARNIVTRVITSLGNGVNVWSFFFSRGVLRYFTQTWRNNSFRCFLRRLPRVRIHQYLSGMHLRKWACAT
jgi:hypothetical protein